MGIRRGPNVEGTAQTEELLHQLDTALVFTNLVQTDMSGAIATIPRPSTAASSTLIAAFPSARGAAPGDL